MRALFLSYLLLFGSVSALAQSNVEIVERAYATFGAGDAEGWAVLHTDDFVWTIFGDLPQSGRRVGTQAVIDEVMDVLPRYWPTLIFEPIEVYEQGDVIFVHTRMKADGMDTESLHMFHLREGKIASFTAFDDTDAMRASMVE